MIKPRQSWKPCCAARRNPSRKRQAHAHLQFASAATRLWPEHRDIGVRAVAQGRSVDTMVADVMSKEVLYCFDTDDLEEVSRNMGKAQVRRLPVVNADKRLVGIISLGDLARSEDPTTIGRTVSRVSTPSGKHDQTSTH